MTVDNFCFYVQNRLIQTGQTGSSFSVSWVEYEQGRNVQSVKRASLFTPESFQDIVWRMSHELKFFFLWFSLFIFSTFLSEKKFFYNGQLDPGSTVADHSTREPKIEGSNPYPGPNVIKLFMAVIYEFS
jgi:hypothetical protein